MPRPRRSALYVPGANERALEKAKTLSADVLILDLEDAVAQSAKIAARERVCKLVANGGFSHCEVAIRVNGFDTPWHADDLRATVAARPAAIIVPKVNSNSDVRTIEWQLGAVGASQDLQIWAMLETPIAVLQAAQIASSSNRLAVLVIGTNDLANELHAEHVPGRQPLWFALSACLLAARSAGKAVLDGVYNDITDPAGFEAECLQARQMGFDGKTLIHPSQIASCNRVFTPSPAAMEHARKIIAAFDQALREGRGVAAVDGRMIENLHVESARRMLAVGQAIAELEA